jgi:hypothetical protein
LRCGRLALRETSVAPTLRQPIAEAIREDSAAQQGVGGAGATPL